jgi:hypothetical protein
VSGINTTAPILPNAIHERADSQHMKTSQKFGINRDNRIAIQMTQSTFALAIPCTGTFSELMKYALERFYKDRSLNDQCITSEEGNFAASDWVLVICTHGIPYMPTACA